MIRKALFVAMTFAVGSSFALAQSISTERLVPYAKDAEISSKIRSECVKLQEQLATFIQEYAREAGQQVALVDSVSTRAKGRVLKVEIVEAVSMGNAFIGHQKYTRIAGTLYKDGKKLASFKGRRNSMGGFFGGYKGSCSVLGRTVKALGQDVGVWLASPKDEARLGDM